VSVPTGTGGPGDADTQAAFAATLVDEWVRGGVSHAVVCPGSRSTPLAVALAGQGRVEVHVQLDERSAGFTGLGIGMATGRPAMVLTTSGTAAAELHAAVVEADLGRVPLLVCTADRPPELREVGASQTIDQLHLYGRAVRWFADPGVPVGTTRTSWRSLAARSVAEAMSGPAGPGPVHLNLPFREPLLGDVAAGGGVTPGRGEGAPWHTVVVGGRSPDEEWLRSRVEAGPLRPASRGVIVVGAGCGEPEPILAMAELLGWPVLADPRSGLRRRVPGVIGAADGILRSDRFAGRHLPDCIVRLGERWVSKAVNGFLSRAVEHGAHSMVVDPAGRWSDPEREVAEVVRADPTRFARDVAQRVADLGRRPGAGTGRPPWVAEWQRAEDRAQGAMDRHLGGPGRDAALTEPSLARLLYEWLPDTSTLVVSSSMPIRDIESFAGPRDRPPRVLSNRGANGIDGVVSTATGVALAGPGPTVALVGDLAFLHDVSALVGAEGVEVDLTVVVADNRGGGIFSFLDPASALDPETFDTLFATPQAPDPASVAAGFGWTVDDVGPDAGAAGLQEALARRGGGGSRSMIRVQLPGGAANVARHHDVIAAIVDAVDRPEGG
jgi:2-succinyl-5-enolpyruvyl-6-hydroxy-3-cyclohexene-1-carboxylate synthase